MAHALMTEVVYAADAIGRQATGEKRRMELYRELPEFMGVCDIIIEGGKKADFRYGNIIVAHAQQLRERLERINARNPYSV